MAREMTSIVEKIIGTVSGADKWEMDTLACLKATAPNISYARFSKVLRLTSLDYAKRVNPWTSIDTPDWIQKAVADWDVHYYPASHGSPASECYQTMNFSDDVFQYLYRRRFVHEWGGGWEPDEGSCSSRKYLTGEYSWSIAENSPVISACYCPHWTPPQKIAELLLQGYNMQKTENHGKYNKCAVAIYNDDICTYAVLGLE